MSQLLHRIELRLAAGDAQPIFATLILYLGASATLLNCLGSSVSVVAETLALFIPLWLCLIYALNRGLSIAVITHLAATMAAIEIAIVAWYSGGIYASVLAYMGILATANYFFIGRRAALIWLLLYFFLHLFMAFGDRWTGVVAPLTEVSLAQSVNALIDNSLVAMALVLVILFFHHSDVQSHIRLAGRQDELGTEAAKLKTLMVARERVFSTLGNEIADPLFAIQQRSENAMARYANAPNVSMVLEHNIRWSMQARRAVDELLDYARLSAGQIAVRMQYLVVRDALRSWIQGWQARPNARERYVLEFDKALPLVVYTDKDLLLQVLDKLIDCATEVSGAGRLAIHAQAQGDQAILIAVATAQAQEQALAQSDRLAWPIAQSAAQLLGATVGIEHGPGPGRRFWLRLPIPVTS